MKIDASKLWESVLKELAENISRPNYDTWLRGTIGLSFQGSTLIVGTRSEFVNEWLERRLKPLILKLLAEAAEEPVDVNFKTIPQNQENEDTTLALNPVENTAKSNRKNQPSYKKDENAAKLTLHKNYIFESFVVGSSNRLAFAAAQSTSTNPGREFNPLFLYGGSGLGKTHLLHAIGHAGVKKGLNVVYLSAEQFTNRLIASIQKRSQKNFRNIYRKTDILLVDDIQFIAGKEQTQEEFFHTFNELYEAGKQIVISSDKSPNQIKHLEDRLRSRFEWGMLADLQVPNIETRVAILQEKSKNHQITLDNDILYKIADKCKNNVRELEGSLTRLLAVSRLTGKEINDSLVENTLKHLQTPDLYSPPSIDLIVGVVCDYYKLENADLLSNNREKQYAYPRQMAMYLLREVANISLVEIGKSLGNRDHSTVHHGWRKMDKGQTVDQEIKRDVSNLKELIDRKRRVA
ncbi:MAG: chromosomal replication initiator protein DnaA [Dehalococcoidia bacterium]|nr:chromosomal replication initiator protein DnaA [Dehalococcoidia bacterium]